MKETQGNNANNHHRARLATLALFEGARSPLDGTADGDTKKLCECHKQVTKADTCDDMMGGANADCDLKPDLRRAWRVSSPHHAPRLAE